MKEFFSKLLTTLAITALFFYVGCVFIEQESQLNNLEDEKNHYQALLDEAIMKTEELKETRERINTDEYIEEYAREKLGLVMPYETIFVDASI